MKQTKNENQEKQKKWYKKPIAIVVFLVILGFYFASFLPSSEKKNKNTGTTSRQNTINIDYKIIDKEDFSFHGRKRVSISIYKETNDITDRVVVIKQAARNLIKTDGADVASVYLYTIPFMNPAVCGGMNIARATYAPDGKGRDGDTQNWIWEISVSEANLTEQMNRILSAYCEFEDFSKPENEVIMLASKKIGMPADEFKKQLMKMIVMLATQKNLK